jgi:hypothetical protein
VRQRLGTAFSRGRGDCDATRFYGAHGAYEIQRRCDSGSDCQRQTLNPIEDSLSAVARATMACHPLKFGLASEAALHKNVGGGGRTTTIPSASLVPQPMGDLLVEVRFDLFVGEAVDDFI